MMKDYFANVKKVYKGIENKVTQYEWGKEVAPGITAIAPPAIRPDILPLRSLPAPRKS